MQSRARIRILLALSLLSAGMAHAGSSADMAVSKSGPSSAAAGSDVVYAIDVFNVGPDAASAVSLADSVPPGMTFVSVSQNSGPAFTCGTPAVGGTGTVTCTLVSMASGASASFDLSLNIPPATPPATTFTNTATVSAASFDPNEKNNAASTATTTPGNFADVSVNKIGPSVAGPGSDVAYTLSVVNNGPAVAQTISLDDALPGAMTFVSLSQLSGPTFSCSTPAIGAGGTVTCTIAALAAGAGASFSLVGQVPAATPSGTTFANVATITSAQDPTPENDVGNVFTVVSSANLAISKNGPANVTAGQNVVYTIALSNSGPDTSIGAGFEDTLPAQTGLVSLTQDSGPTATCTTGSVVSCRIPSLPSATNAAFTLTLLVAGTAPNDFLLSNTANARSDGFDPVVSNDSATSTATVANSVDLAVAKSGPATVIAGQSATYTISLVNNGPDAAVAANLVDTFPPGTSFVSILQTAGPASVCSNTAGTATCSASAALAAGASLSYSLVLQVSAAAPNGSVLTNSVVAQSSTPESAPASNSAGASTTVNNTADLALTKSGPSAVSAGSTISYGLNLTNNGPVGASSVQLTDPLPAPITFVSLLQNSGPALTCTTPAVGANGSITCTIATLATGASASFTLTGLVPAGVPDGTLLNNTAAVQGGGTDPNVANDTATAGAVVANVADLVVSKSGPAAATAGQNISYAITVANTGSTPAGSVQWTDVLPASTSFVSFAQNSGPAYTCSTPAVGAAGSVNCSLASLAPGGSAAFTLVVNIATSVPNGSALSNSLSALTASADINPANNTASTSAVVANTADLVLSKSGPSLVVRGASIDYTIGIVNNGPAPASNVQIVDVLPGATTFLALVQTSGPAFTCTTPAVGSGGSVICSATNLVVGVAASFTLRVDTAGVAPGPLANTVSGSSSSLDPTPANDAASSSASVVQGLVNTAIPALSGWMLVLLGALLAGIGAAIQRRRHASAAPTA